MILVKYFSGKQPKGLCYVKICKFKKLLISPASSKSNITRHYSGQNNGVENMAIDTTARLGHALSIGPLILTNSGWHCLTS